MTPILRMAANLRYLRLKAELTQEQLAEIVGIGLKFYQRLEGGRKPQVKLDTVERLARPFSLEAWQLLAPDGVVRKAKFKKPRPKTQSERGPRS